MEDVKNEMPAAQPSTTDEWPISKILKYTFWPKPAGSPKAGMIEILLRVAMAGVFFLLALSLKNCGSSPSVTSGQTTTTPKSAVDYGIRAYPSLASAIDGFRPEMTDSTNGSPSDGALLLAMWGTEKMRLEEIQQLPSSKAALVKKESSAERGKKICVSGSIIQIEVDKSTGKRIYFGGMSDYNGDIYRFIATGSTGELVERSSAKFCGVVIGAVSYPNSIGGVAHGVQLVGMFDLPENKK
jgi:hypothetical protein